MNFKNKSKNEEQKRRRPDYEAYARHIAFWQERGYPYTDEDIAQLAFDCNVPMPIKSKEKND